MARDDGSVAGSRSRTVPKLHNTLEARDGMSRWERRQYKLPEKHGWTAREGYNVFVADRGALRLDFPADWVVKPAEASIRFHDREPPDDRCCIEVSYVRLSPIDWSGLLLRELLKAACQAEGQVIGDDEIAQTVRADLELVWAEYSRIDPAEKRPAFHRICMARTTNAMLPHPRRKKARIVAQPIIQALLTAAYWPEDAAWFHPVWDEVLRSLQLGIMIPSPAGPTRH